MSKTGLRIAAALSFAAGVAAVPLSLCLFPYARAAASLPATDGHRYVTSVDAGSWVLKAGFAAAAALIVLAAVLLWRARRRRATD